MSLRVEGEGKKGRSREGTLSEVASFVRLGMGPASDREAVLLFLIGLPRYRLRARENKTGVYFSGLLFKNTVYSPLLPKGMIPLFRSGDDSLLGWLSSLLSYKW